MNIKFLKALPKSIRLAILFVFFLFNSFILQSQTLDLNVKDEPLNSLLVQLRDSHNLKFSFDDELLSNFRITINKSFNNPDEAITFIIQDLPLTAEKIDGVIVIYPKIAPKQNTAKSKQLFIGYLSDASSGESLPYSHVSINDHRLIADGQGRFTYSSTEEQDFRLQISYLGYYTLDSILLSAGEHHLKLQPSVVGIKEIVVKDKSYKISTMSSFNSGEINLNHQIGSYLPGFADNALYNLLRLQPGVLAAGEQSNDLIIWGSYRGQTEVLFDGFTIFGLKNFNDNIGVVNPNMVQDVRLLKGGYPANYGGKVGAIVDISGTDGNKQKPEFILSATNMTLNSKISVPITNKSVLSGAFRQTYYNLYKNTELNPFIGSRASEKSLVDINVSPDYMFRDFLVKYSGVTDSGDSYHFDLLHGIDRFYYNLDIATFNDNLVKNSVDESNAQTGSSFFYGKVWENGNKSDLTISYSDLINQLTTKTNFENARQQSIIRRYEEVNNQIKEIKAKAEHLINLNHNHSLELGAGFKGYNISLSEDTIDQNLYYSENKALALEGYFQDRISLKNGLNLIPGIRIDAPGYLKKLLIQPRLSMNYELSPHLRIKAALGKYDQYVVQSSVLDEAGNYRYFWTLSDGVDIPLQTANHLTAGVSYQTPKFSFGVESFLKRLNGLTRYVYLPNFIEKKIYIGDGISGGLDFLFEAKYKKHSAWIAYTLSKTVERFPYFAFSTYKRSPQDQLHEIKAALLLDFHPFYISSNYVFGSGFPDRSILQFQRNTTNLVYSRWDISGVYKVSFKKFDLQAGLSILNLLNTENIKLQNLVKIPDLQGKAYNIMAEAVPFTPTLFLVIEF